MEKKRIKGKKTHAPQLPQDLSPETVSAVQISKGQDYPTRVLNDMSTGVLVLDSHGKIVYINRPASKMLEMDESLPSETDLNRLLSDQKNDQFNDYIFAAIQNKQVTHVGAVEFFASSGRRYVFRMSSSYLNNTDAQDLKSSEVVITFTDETKADEMQRKYNDSSRCFVIGIVCVCVWTLIYAMWESMNRSFSVDFLTHGTEVMGLIMMFFIFRYTSFTAKELGITMKDPLKTIRTALIISAGSIAFLAVVKLIGQGINPTWFHPEAPFIDFSRFGVRQLLYILTAGIQEFIARSILQNNIRRIMVGRRIAFKAIVLSSLMFSALHIQHGFFFMIGAGVLGGLEGILYEKQQNIFGTWIVHWFFGVAGTLFGLV